jgi:inward rectifier potassium channel
MSDSNKPNDINEDLGLGARVVQENQTRFLNPDGSFNVRRKGIFDRGFFSPYHAIMNASWPRFYSEILAAYIMGNVLFTALYLSSGIAAFPSISGENALSRFGNLFYYSVQITTLAHNSLEPATLLAKFFVSLEAILGLLAFALGAALIMARFSNPATQISFSERGIVAPYKDTTAFMTRIINRRNSELIEVAAVITLAMEGEDGKREVHRLQLEREKVFIFPLSWTIVHPITKESPLYGLSADDLKRRKAEFVITISAVDENLSKTVYARHSYISDEMMFGVKFKNILERTEDGTIVVDPARIHEIES